MEDYNANSTSMMEDDDASPRDSYVVEDEEEEEEDDEEDSYHGQPLKRLKRVQEDRLSELPDSMMTHVLSFLPVVDAVKTQLISKRFLHVWTWITTLSFWSNRRSSTNCYSQVISNALMLHRAPSIKKFCLLETGWWGHYTRPALNMWVQAAVLKGVQELVLQICHSIQSLSFPNSLLLCDTLREFSLSAIEIHLGSSCVSWKSLEKLTLNSIRNLDDDKLRKIVEGSPALERLSLIQCKCFSRVVIESPSSNVRNLVIHCNFHSKNHRGGEEDSQGGDYLEISAPKITSLEISGCMGYKHCRLKDVSSLARVALRFYMCTTVKDSNSTSEYNIDSESDNDNENDNDVDDMSPAMMLEKCELTLLDLLKKLGHVEKISMGTWCTQILSVCELRKRPGITLKCKSLEVEGLFEESVPGIARLMQTSPLLETLSIDMGAHVPCDQFLYCDELLNFGAENYWESRRKELKNAVLRLEVLQLTGLNTTHASLMTELAEFVLRRSRLLEKLVFKPGISAYQNFHYRDDLRHVQVFNVLQKLLSYRRCSPLARVLLL